MFPRETQANIRIAYVSWHRHVHFEWTFFRGYRAFYACVQRDNRAGTLEDIRSTFVLARHLEGGG